jgi:hypothetical protein
MPCTRQRRDQIWKSACDYPHVGTTVSHAILGDLISYQNDGKGCTTIVGKVERA